VATMQATYVRWSVAQPCRLQKGTKGWRLTGPGGSQAVSKGGKE